MTRHYVTAEIYDGSGESSARTYGPAGGLTEEDYHRLDDDDVVFETSQALAWAVIDNLLWKKGLISSQILRTRRLVPKGTITDLIEANSFETVAAVLFNEMTKAPKKKRM